MKLHIIMIGSVYHQYKEQNRWRSNGLSSRLYQFYALCTQRLSSNKDLLLTRENLFNFYQTARLQQNESAQSILIVLILQCYLSSNLYNLANKFAEKAEIPEISESQYYAYFIVSKSIRFLLLFIF